MKTALSALLFLQLLYMGAQYPQNPIAITKAEVLEKVTEKNNAIKIAQENFTQAKADHSQTNALFLPTISVAHTGISTNNPVMAFGSKLNQGVFSENDFAISSLTNPGSIENFTTSFQIQQPLFNVDGIYQRKAAKNKMDAMALHTERTRDYLTLEAEKSYMQLQLAYKTVHVLERVLEAAKANRKLADDQFTQGYLQRADVLSMDVRVTEVQSQLQQGHSHIKNTSEYLAYLMNDQTSSQYVPADSLNLNTMTQELEGSSLSERPDIKAMQLSKEAYEAQYRADKMAFLPRLNAFGSYDLFDRKAFQGSANSYVVGAQLTWTVLEGTKRYGKTKKSRSELEKSKLQYEQYLSQSHLELHKAQRILDDAENKLQLTELAVEQSEEALRIRTNRFEQGLEKTTELLQSENQYAQKQLEYFQTVFEYNFAKAYLEFLTKGD
ncbi:TolC family protein [Arenibacter sp. GZD96]|uniref:TolC family protein n=1 Tax=Aurantibrevibacter litoralis TaxID=3106030 RepID=UPI002AFECE5E|nr:TolC family protein [Arenibacter sp. GZD-96]MEA1787443.1 TolC family protein [Arenibacter sp. GZD-96]